MSLLFIQFETNIFAKRINSAMQWQLFCNNAVVLISIFTSDGPKLSWSYLAQFGKAGLYSALEQTGLKLLSFTWLTRLIDFFLDSMN